MVEKKKISTEFEFLAPVTVPDLIRLGKDYDGGYILTNDVVLKSSALISLGVNDDWSFDIDWRKLKPNDKIHAYDGTISPSKMHPQLLESYIDFFGADAHHYPVNIGADTMYGQSSLKDALIRINSDRVFIKMDIEGSEWNLTNTILNYANSITGMVVEFHNTENLRTLFVNTIKKYQEYFHVIHVHPNTSCPFAVDNFPTVVEISFVNKSLIKVINQVRKDFYLPNLDQANVPNTNDVSLYI